MFIKCEKYRLTRETTSVSVFEVKGNEFLL